MNTFRPGEMVVVTLPGHRIEGAVLEATPRGSYRIRVLPSMGPSYPNEIEVEAVHLRRSTLLKNAPGVAVKDIDGDEMPMIYGRLLKMTMQKTHGRYKGEKFYHNFKQGAKSYGLPAGCVVVLPSGKKITLDRRCILLKSDNDLWGHYV